MQLGKRRKHDPKYKEEAVQLAKDFGNVATAGKELGIGYSLLHSWIRAAVVASAKGNVLALDLKERQEMERLRKLVTEQAEEVEVIKKTRRILQRNGPRQIRLDRGDESRAV